MKYGKVFAIDEFEDEVEVCFAVCPFCVFTN